MTIASVSLTYMNMYFVDSTMGENEKGKILIITSPAALATGDLDK